MRYSVSQPAVVDCYVPMLAVTTAGVEVISEEATLARVASEPVRGSTSYNRESGDRVLNT